MNSYLINGPKFTKITKEEKSNDPRWDALKKLKNKEK